MSPSLFLICEMGRRMLALHDITQLLTSMLKLDAGSCKTRVHSRLFPSGRMGDWGRLDAVFISFWGRPLPPSPAHRFSLLLWEMLADFLAAAPQAGGGGCVESPQGSPSVSVALTPEASVERQATAGLHLRSLPQSWEEGGLLREEEVSQVRIPSPRQVRFRAWALRCGAEMGADLSGW